MRRRIRKQSQISVRKDKGGMSIRLAKDHRVFVGKIYKVIPVIKIS